MNKMTGESRQLDEVRTTLSRLAEGYSDGLRAETRRRIVRQSLDAVASSGESGRPGSFGFPQLIAAAAVLAILALPALFISRETGREVSPVRDLEVSQKGDEVVLTWKDGQAPRKVVRATSLQEVARASSLPGEVVRGERYVDSRSDGAQIVYYIVE